MVRLQCEFDSRCRLILKENAQHDCYKCSAPDRFNLCDCECSPVFKSTDLTKAVRDKMLARAFKGAFLTVTGGWFFFELFMIMRIEPSFEVYRIVMLIIVIISLIVFGLNLKVQNQRPE